MTVIKNRYIADPFHCILNCLRYIRDPNILLSILTLEVFKALIDHNQINVIFLITLVEYFHISILKDMVTSFQ